VQVSVARLLSFSQYRPNLVDSQAARLKHRRVNDWTRQKVDATGFVPFQLAHDFQPIP